MKLTLYQNQVPLFKKKNGFSHPLIHFVPFQSTGDAKTFVDLASTQRYIAPRNVDQRLLGEQFIRVETENEAQLLRKLGVKHLSKPDLFLEVILPNYSTFPVSLRATCTVAVLEEVASLVGPSATVQEQTWPAVAIELRKALKKLPCVCNDKGKFVLPSNLYDPRNSQLAALLDSSFFPDKTLFPPSILPKLSSLGLRQSLDPVGILDCAKSVGLSLSENVEEDGYEATGEGNLSKCRKRAKALLLCLDERQRNEELEFVPDRLIEYIEKKRSEEELFWADLKTISWCPIVRLAPEPYLPWMKTGTSTLIAPPCQVRPSDQMWQVSASFFILDGVIRSSSLPFLLGWNEAVPSGTLARQLAEVSKSFTRWKRASEVAQVQVALEESSPAESSILNMPNEIRRATLKVSKEATNLLSLMDNVVKTRDFGSIEVSVIASTLSDVPCVWVSEAETFLEPKCLALVPPPDLDLRPYLFSVPPELQTFRLLLVRLGVGKAFTTKSYLGALRQLSRDAGGTSLSQQQVEICVRLLQALSEALRSETERAQQRYLAQVLLPDSKGILKPSQDLVYNDSAWLPNEASGDEASLSSPVAICFLKPLSSPLTDSILVTRSLVHSSVPSSLASSLGAKSLRYLSLVDQEMTKTLPCVSAFRLSKLLTFWGDSEAFLFDLLEVADVSGAFQVDIVYDKREHGVQSLLQPNLGWSFFNLIFKFVKFSFNADVLCSSII